MDKPDTDYIDYLITIDHQVRIKEAQIYRAIEYNEEIDEKDTAYTREVYTN